MTETCPTCASPVTVEGNTTKYCVSENEQLSLQLYACGLAAQGQIHGHFKCEKDFVSWSEQYDLVKNLWLTASKSQNAAIDLAGKNKRLLILLKSIGKYLDEKVSAWPCEASVYTITDDDWGDLMGYRDEIFEALNGKTE